jgi:hypothetical protein
MSVRKYRTRSHEASVSVCHHADEWLLVPHRRTVMLTRFCFDHGTRPHRPTDAGRVAGSVTGRP